MNRKIQKVAVLGSGIMGSGLACLFANTGTDVLLLNRIHNDRLKHGSEPGLSKRKDEIKDPHAEKRLRKAIDSSPPPLYHEEFLSRITTGNFRDHISRISDCDWIIEAVVEDLTVKKEMLALIDKHRKPGTLVTSTTSSNPVRLLAENRSDDFKLHFCGTHFSNPPRYLKLLEVIPTTYTREEVLNFLIGYANQKLGKRTVICKDTPAFISNRIGMFIFLRSLESMKKWKLNVDEIDRLTGSIIGLPKSATFRTADIIGLDTLIRVSETLHEGVDMAPLRSQFRLPEVLVEMKDRGWLGVKTGRGFYKKIKEGNERSEILTLDLDTLKYNPQKKVRFRSVGKARRKADLSNRINLLLKGKDKVSGFYRDYFYGLFQYISNRIPDIADELFKIDDGMRAGFGWQMGPFEIWDSLGIEHTLEEMKSYGYSANKWVSEMIQNGFHSFYSITDGTKYFYDTITGSKKPVPGMESFIILDNIRDGKVIWKNKGASVFDLGDGILNLEFHSKMNTMGAEVMEGINTAIDLAEEKFSGLVIGNQGQNFTVGADLGILFMYAIEQDYEGINRIVQQFQQTVMLARYSKIPVVLAPHSLTLGGGCELSMHADQVQAAAETYIGLPEVGVGIIPSGGGTKELTKRLSDRYFGSDDYLSASRVIFENIATGKVSTSAHEGYDMMVLASGDNITINSDRLIADAKQAAIHLAEGNYSMPDPNKKIHVPGGSAISSLVNGYKENQKENGYSDFDIKLAEKIANVMCGGDLSMQSMVTEQYLLDLEREAVLSLCGEKKTLERIQAILLGRKPLRN